MMAIIHKTYETANFRTLDLNLLQVFDQVMTERNLTRAARNLSMTQPAVSNALNRLRDALGDRLVARSGYGVEPRPRRWRSGRPSATRCGSWKARSPPGLHSRRSQQAPSRSHGGRHRGRAGARPGGDPGAGCPRRLGPRAAAHHAGPAPAAGRGHGRPGRGLLPAGARRPHRAGAGRHAGLRARTPVRRPLCLRHAQGPSPARVP